MTISSMIRPDLWQNVSNAYVAENYKSAILDAMHFLTKLIREKTDLDLDGSKLVNEVFGGKNPKIKINKFETQTDLDEQQGFTFLLLGLYQGIRNPRSHELMDDKKETADATIIFISFIMNKIDNSILTFTTENFLNKVFDPDFVKNAEYATELFNEIPKKRLLEVLIEIFRKRLTGDKENLILVTEKIISSLNEKDSELFFNMVSDEMQIERTENAISTTIYLLPPGLWLRLKKTARMRIENKILNSIKEGKVKIYSDEITKGHLGTWAHHIRDYLLLEKEFKQVILTKTSNGNEEDILYILKFFSSSMLNFLVEDYQISRCVNILLRMVSSNNDLINYITDTFRRGSSKWKDEIKLQCGKYTDEERPIAFLSDGTPILKWGFTIEIDEQEEEGDIPF